MPPSDHDAGRGGRRGRRRAAHGLTRWIARRDSDGLCASDRSAASKPHTLASGGELPCEPHTLASGGELPCEPPPRRLEAMPCALLSRRAARPQAKGRRRRSRPRRTPRCEVRNQIIFWRLRPAATGLRRSSPGRRLRKLQHPAGGSPPSVRTNLWHPTEARRPWANSQSSDGLSR